MNNQEKVLKSGRNNEKILFEEKLDYL